jgi:hypothetical protein
MSFNYTVIDADQFIKYDLSTRKSEILSIRELQNELAAVLDDLENLPLPMSDEDLLAWARENYPGMDYETRRTYLNNKRLEIIADLGMV